jgi:hypothetical protein
MKKTSAIRIFGFVLGICLIAGMASSVQTLRLALTNTNAQVGVGPAAALTCLDLSSAAGAQTIAGFATPASRVVVRFSAECAVGGPTTSWVNLDIIVDPAGAAPPAAIAPTATTDNAFCSGNGTAVADGWVSAEVQGYAVLPAGAHTVRVCVNGVNPGSNWRIDDSSLTIESDP